MGNIVTYVQSCGRKDFSARAFNDVDALVLSYLAYYDFREIVPDSASDASVSLASASALYRKKIGDSQLFVNPSLLYAMEDSPRFRDLRLLWHETRREIGKVQYAALTVLLPNGTACITFRGLDNSVTAWEEACSLAFTEIPSQGLALDYLRRILPLLEKKQLLPILAGHSKGGHLAQYAAFRLPRIQRDQIGGLYLMDAPGLRPGTYDTGLLLEFKSRMHRIAPGFSVLDSLFRRGDPDRIVQSSYRGFPQHFPFSWCVEEEDFVPAPRIETGAACLRRALNRMAAAPEPSRGSALVAQLARTLRRIGMPEESVEFTGDLTPGSCLLSFHKNAAADVRRTAQKLLFTACGSAAAFYITLPWKRLWEHLAPAEFPGNKA